MTRARQRYATIPALLSEQEREEDARARDAEMGGTRTYPRSSCLLIVAGTCLYLAVLCVELTMW